MMKSTRLHGLSALLLTLFLLTALPFALAEDTPALPVQAVVNSPINGAANLCNHPDDYFTPQAVFFNGTPVTVLDIVSTQGDFPAELKNEGEENWARVVIGKTEDYAGVEGYMPLAVLSFDLSLASALPQAALENEGPVHQDNGLSDKLLGEYAKGTELNLMGWLLDWAQVELEGKTGFVRHEALLLDEAAHQSLAQALPPSFDEIQPGHQDLYAAYTHELMALYAQHGDSNEWPLAVKAQASELAAGYGYRYTPDINVMPGANDLSQEEVLALARAAAEELFGLPEGSWSDYGLSFSYPEEAPEQLGWKINLWAKPGGQDAVIWMDREGNLTQSLLNEVVPGEFGRTFAAGAMNDPTTQVEHYLYGKNAQPAEGVLSQQEAQDMAWNAFQAAYDQADAREEYLLESRYLRNDEDTLQWWLVSILPPFPQEWEVRYDVALLSPRGETSYATDLALFEENMVWAKRQKEFDNLEMERGPYNTWTLEQKAAWDPGYYGLPQEGEIPMAQAIDIAQARLKDDFSLSQEDFARLEEGVFFEIVSGRTWRVAYMTKGDVTEGEPWEYYGVTLDPLTAEVTEVIGPYGME